MTQRAPTLFRVARVPIRVHWSWLAALAVVVVALSRIYARAVLPGSTVEAALGAVVLLFVSVVLHELAHALVARRCGLRVGSITLVALGGFTEIVDEARRPGQELLVALAGPAASLVLALLSGLGWWFSPWPLAGLVAWHLALTNVVIAAFNLLPCYPLDGGRVLRATLWFLLSDELRGARLALDIGRGCGWLLFCVGLFYLLTTGDVLNGGWLALGGFLLSRAAARGHQQFVLQRVLRGVRVADVMQRTYRAVAPDLRLDHFVGRYVLGKTEKSFPVLLRPEQGAPQQLLGMITVRNLRRFTLNQWPFVRVREAMTPLQQVRALLPDAPASDAFRALLQSGEDQLPVMDGEVLLGMLRRRDLSSSLRRFVERNT